MPWTTDPVDRQREDRAFGALLSSASEAEVPDRRRRYAVIDWDRAAQGSEDAEFGEEPTLCREAEANLVTSLLDEDGTLPVHLPALDIDLPCSLVPSSTPGHFHLFVDHPMSQDAYWALLDALEVAGLVEAGWVRSAKHRGYTALRHNCTKEPRP